MLIECTNFLFSLAWNLFNPVTCHMVASSWSTSSATAWAHAAVAKTIEHICTCISFQHLCMYSIWCDNILSIFGIMLSFYMCYSVHEIIINHWLFITLWKSNKRKSKIMIVAVYGKYFSSHKLSRTYVELMRNQYWKNKTCLSLECELIHTRKIQKKTDLQVWANSTWNNLPNMLWV
jgi:hypothetical protein